MLRRQLLQICGRTVLSNIRFCASIEKKPIKNCEGNGSPLFDELVSKYENKELMVKLFEENEAFMHSDIYFWDTFIGTLSEHSFKTSDCLKIVRKFPTALGFSRKKLTTTLTEWSLRSTFTQKYLVFLILNRPELLDADPVDIKKRVPFLLSNFGSKEALMSLLLLCPNLLYDSWNEIMRKLDFITSEMVVYKSEVVRSKALSKKFQHIRLRFTVLEKCGVYTRPNPYAHKQTKKERLMLNNPILKEITDTSDKVFARKIANITLEEYEVFKDIFTSENDEDDDLSDSDVDD